MKFVMVCRENTRQKTGATDEMIAEAVACAMFVSAGSQLS